MVQSIQLAQHEFISTFGHRTWIENVAGNLHPGRELRAKSVDPDPKSKPGS